MKAFICHVLSSQSSARLPSFKEESISYRHGGSKTVRPSEKANNTKRRKRRKRRKREEGAKLHQPTLPTLPTRAGNAMGFTLFQPTQGCDLISGRRMHNISVCSISGLYGYRMPLTTCYPPHKAFLSPHPQHLNLGYSMHCLAKILEVMKCKPDKYFLAFIVKLVSVIEQT